MNGFRGWWVGIGIVLAGLAPLATMETGASEANPPAEAEAEETSRPLWLTALLAEGARAGDAGPTTTPQGCATPDVPHATNVPDTPGSIDQERSLLFAAVAVDVLAPHHAAFIKATESLVEDVTEYCVAPAEGDVEVVAAGWAVAMDAWQCVQVLRDGPLPVNENNHRFRIQFFPDPNEAVQRNVETLLEGDEPITEARLRGSPVGTQGLPAFERLLFDDSLRLDDPEPEAASRPCELANAIAKNLHSLAKEIGEPWAADGAVHRGFVNVGDPFTGSDDVLAVVLEAIHQQAEFIADTKIDTPLAQGNVGGLESYLAGRSKENIVTNVSALQALVDDEDENTYRLRDYLARAHEEGNGEAIGTDLAAELAHAEKLLAALDASIEDIVGGNDADEREALEAIGRVFHRISLLGEDAAVAAGVQLGFTHDDGD